MATPASKNVVTQYSVSFDSTVYDCKSIPAGVPASCEPPDVTVGTDVNTRHAAAAYTEDGEITVTMSGKPTINSVGTLKLVRKVSTAGAAAASSDVTVGSAIVTNITPSDIEAGGDRVRWYDVTFKPTGDRT